MTAEIAVLNKFGISIAADSAVTVETFHDGEVKQKVYNSTNKIFALSKRAPIESAPTSICGRTEGRFAFETFMNVYDPDFRALAEESPLAEIAARITGSGLSAHDLDGDPPWPWLRFLLAAVGKDLLR